MKAIIKIIMVFLTALVMLAVPFGAGAQDSTILDGYSADIPQELDRRLSAAGITPQSIDSNALSLDKVISNVTGMLWDSIQSPLKLLVSLLGVTLLCSVANVFADNSGNLKTVFSVVSVLACSTLTVTAGKRFIDGGVKNA